MILPNTTYHTYENIPLRLQDGSNKNAAHDSGILKEDQPFLISLWADPREAWLQIELDKQQQKKDTAAAQFYIAANSILDSCENTTDFSQAIYFYSPLDDYGAFSNFSSYGIEVEEVFYPTVEHYYQAQKFEDVGYCEKIRKADTPKMAASLGKQRIIPLKTNWEVLKVTVMATAIKHKIEQHSDFKDLLLATQDALLIENSPYDNFWGIGSIGTGMNFLGTVLMRQRAQLKRNK